MPKLILTPKEFLTGIAKDGQFGDALWEDQQAVDVERSENQGGVGALRSGYGNSSLGTIGVLYKRVAKAPSNNISAAANAGHILFFFGSLSATRIDPQNIIGSGVDAISSIGFTASAITRADLGAGYLSSVSGSQVWVAVQAGTTSAVDRLVQLDTISGSFSYNEPAAGSAFNGINVPHPSYLKNNIRWWGDRNQVAKLTTDTGLTLNVLDIEPNFTIQDIGEYDRYLALLATEGNHSRAIRSKLYLWDMIQDSWNYDFPIHDAGTKLASDRGELRAYTIGQGFSIQRFTGNGFEPIRMHRDPYYAKQLPFHTDCVDVDRGKHYISLKRTDGSGNEYVEVMTMGSYLEESTKMDSPFLPLAGGTSRTAGAVAVGGNSGTAENKVYQASQSAASTFAFNVFKTGNLANAEATTIDLDFLMDRSGALKRMNWIRFEFDRINTDGDQVDIYELIDYIGVGNSTRLDGGTLANKNNSLRKTDLGATALSKTFPIRKLFRHYKLRLVFVGGNVRIRRIVFDYDFVKSTGE